MGVKTCGWTLQHITAVLTSCSKLECTVEHLSSHLGAFVYFPAVFPPKLACGVFGHARSRGNKSHRDRGLQHPGSGPQSPPGLYECVRVPFLCSERHKNRQLLFPYGWHFLLCVFQSLQFVQSIGLDKRPFHLIGTSMGGNVAGVYASQYPAYLCSLTMICPSGKLGRCFSFRLSFSFHLQVQTLTLFSKADS